MYLVELCYHLAKKFPMLYIKQLCNVFLAFLEGYFFILPLFVNLNTTFVISEILVTVCHTIDLKFLFAEF